MKYLFIIIAVFSVAFCTAQDNNQVGVLPSVNLNKKVNPNLSLNFKAELRQALVRDINAQPGVMDFAYERSDFSILGSRKIDVNKSVVVGYLLSIKENGMAHRCIQQLILTKRRPGYTLSQRISADQTFSKGEDVEFRLRYRLAGEVSLNGQSVDVKELYFKIGNEYLNSWQGKQYDLEIRVTPFLGYVISVNSKIEIGLDYRLDSFVDGNNRNRYWIGINLFQVL